MTSEEALAALRKFPFRACGRVGRKPLEAIEVLTAELSRLARVEASIKGKTLFDVVAEKVDAEIKLIRSEQERDSLRLELEAARHNARRDNEYLLGERDRLRESLDRILKGPVAEPETVLGVGWATAELQRASQEIQQPISTLVEPQPKCGDQKRIYAAYQDTGWFSCDLPRGHAGDHEGRGQRWRG